MNKISIDGNIGCGKTTQIRMLNDKIRIPIFLEPVEDWKKWLDIFYENPERWGMSFNLNVLLSFNAWKNNTFRAIYERSPLACKNVFTKMQYEEQMMTELEYELFNNIYKQIAWEPEVIIYIRTSPETCYQRTKVRNRSCENGIQLGYLQKLHNKYEELMTKSNEISNIKVFYVDGEQSQQKIHEDIMRILSQLN